jgi:hypothetical protein
MLLAAIIHYFAAGYSGMRLPVEIPSLVTRYLCCSFADWDYTELTRVNDVDVTRALANGRISSILAARQMKTAVKGAKEKSRMK